MDFEAAILMAIVMAFGLHMREHPPTVSRELLTEVFANAAAMCPQMEMGLLCEPALDETLQLADGRAP